MQNDITPKNRFLQLIYKLSIHCLVISLKSVTYARKAMVKVKITMLIVKNSSMCYKLSLNVVCMHLEKNTVCLIA